MAFFVPKIIHILHGLSHLFEGILVCFWITVHRILVCHMHSRCCCNLSSYVV